MDPLVSNGGGALMTLLRQLGLNKTCEALAAELSAVTRVCDSLGGPDTTTIDTAVIEAFVGTPAEVLLEQGTSAVQETVSTLLLRSVETTSVPVSRSTVAYCISEFLLLEVRTSRWPRADVWRWFAQHFQVAAMRGVVTGPEDLRHLEGCAEKLLQSPNGELKGAIRSARAIMEKLVKSGASRSPATGAPPPLAVEGRLRRISFLCQVVDALCSPSGVPSPHVLCALSAVIMSTAMLCQEGGAMRTDLQLVARQMLCAPSNVHRGPRLSLAVEVITKMLSDSASAAFLPRSTPRATSEIPVAKEGRLISAPTCIFNFGIPEDVSRRLMPFGSQEAAPSPAAHALGAEDPSVAEERLSRAEEGDSEEDEEEHDQETDEQESAPCVEVELPEEPQDVAVSPCGIYWAVATSRRRVIIFSTAEDGSLQVRHVLQDGVDAVSEVYVRFSPSDSSRLAVLFGSPPGTKWPQGKPDAVIVRGIGDVVHSIHHRIHPPDGSGVHAATFINTVLTSSRPASSCRHGPVEQLLTAGDLAVLRWEVDTGLVLQTIRIPHCLDVYVSSLTESMYCIDSSGVLSVLDALCYEEVTEQTPAVAKQCSAPSCRRVTSTGSSTVGLPVFGGSLLPMWERPEFQQRSAEADEEDGRQCDADAGAELLQKLAYRNVPTAYRPGKRPRTGPNECFPSGTRVSYTFPSDDSGREQPSTLASVTALGVECREITGRTLLSFATSSAQRSRFLVILAADDTARIAPVSHPSKLLLGYYLAIVFDTVLGQALREMAVCPLVPPETFRAVSCKRILAADRPLRERIMLVRGCLFPGVQEDCLRLLVGGPGQMLYLFDPAAGTLLQAIDLNEHRDGVGSEGSSEIVAATDSCDKLVVAALDFAKQLRAPDVTSYWRDRLAPRSSPNDEPRTRHEMVRGSSLLLHPADRTVQLLTTMNSMGLVSSVACRMSRSGTVQLLCCDELGLCFGAGFDE